MFEPIRVYLNVNRIVRTPPDLPASLVLRAKLKENPNLCQTCCTRIGGKLLQRTSSAAAALRGNTFSQGKQTAPGEKVLPTPTPAPRPLEVLRVQRRSAEHSRERCSVCRLVCLCDRMKGKGSLRGRVTCAQRHRLRDVCALCVSFHPALVGGRNNNSRSLFDDTYKALCATIVYHLLLQSRTESLNGPVTIQYVEWSVIHL